MYKVQEYQMKREEVPECWLGLRLEDIVSHRIDELLEEEIDEEELLN
jgi:hypothetical protein